jgi:Tol biopolymer transport system component
VSGRRAALATAAAVVLLAAGAAAGRDPRVNHVGYRDQVFLVSADGGARRLTNGPEQYPEAVWSHSGTRLAVSVQTGAIEVRSLSGTVKHVIQRGGGAPAWSPDDRRIAFVRSHKAADGRYVRELVVAGLDGRHRRVLATPAAAYPAARPVDWSADGRTIYFRRRERPRSGSIWKVPSGGGKATPLVSNVEGDSDVQVSPDGAHVLFARGNDLWIARTDGGGERALIRPRHAVPRSSGWTARGEVFGGLRHGHPVVATLAGKRRLLAPKITTREYDLSPDGKRVAWVSERWSSRRTLIVSKPASGGRPSVLARFTSKSGLVEDDALAWSPDSRRLVTVPYRHFGD